MPSNNSQTAALKKPQQIPGDLSHVQLLPNLSANKNLDSHSLQTVSYQSLGVLNFADEKVYSLPRDGYPLVAPSQSLAYISKEISSMASLNANLELGLRFQSMLYSYRSVSRGIPQSQQTGGPKEDQAARSQMHQLSYEILKSELQKIKDLQKYCEECTNCLQTCFKSLIPQYWDGTFIASSEVLVMIAKTLDLILVIDSLKNAKASLNNDFSIYKRISANLRGIIPSIDDEIIDNQIMHTFLATQNVFVTKTREKLSGIESFDELLVDVVNHCANMLENKDYLLPSEKSMLLRAIVLGLLLLDRPGEEADILKRKRLKLDRCVKILKLNPVVPFFGDMTMTMATFFVRSPKLSTVKLDVSINDELVENSYLLSANMDYFREKYRDFLVEFTSAIERLNRETEKDEVSIETMGLVYSTVLKSLKLLSEMNCKVREQSAWKFNNPTSPQKNYKCPEDATLYELAVRYNYSDVERQMLCEIIGFIKSISHKLSCVSGKVVKCIQQLIFVTNQTFVRVTLKEMISQASKKKRAILPLIQHLMSIMTDRPVHENEDGSKSKKDKSGSNSSMQNLTSVHAKATGVSHTQFHYIRIILDLAVNERSKGMQGGFLKEKDFKDNLVQDVNEYLQRSVFFPYMMNIFDSVEACGDLSELWYREFYLELTKQIQFPIEMSLPWIIIDHMLETDYRPNAEYIMTPFEIYNDAANRALHHLKCQFLYDEIESEVNLCFDQFIWKLARNIYTDYRILSSYCLLEQQYKRDVEKKVAASDPASEYPNTLLNSLVSQKTVYLLGRYVNVTKLVSQYCNQHLQSCVDQALSRFESSDLSGVIELEWLLQITRLTHKFLSQHLALDPIENVIAECDESLSLQTHNGRIVSHIMQELISDLLPNFCYNSASHRFVRSSLVSKDAVAERSPAPKTLPIHLFGSKHLNSIYANKLFVYKKFIGHPHYLAIARLLGGHQITVMLKEMTTSLELMIKWNIDPYVKALFKGLPTYFKPPPIELGLKGSFDYFQHVLKSIVEYQDLRSGVFQVFRELGNMVAFFEKMEDAMKTNSGVQLIHMASLFDPKYDMTNFKSIVESVAPSINLPQGSFTFEQVATELDRTYNRKEIFPFVHLLLVNLRAVLDKVRNEWEAGDSVSSNKDLRKKPEFHRLWSAVIFAFCCPNKSTGMGNRSIYGDGLAWAGSAFIHVLGEEKQYFANDIISLLYSIHDVSLCTPGTRISLDPYLQQFRANIKFCSFLMSKSLRIFSRYPVNEREPQLIGQKNNVFNSK